MTKKFKAIGCLCVLAFAGWLVTEESPMGQAAASLERRESPALSENAAAKRLDLSRLERLRAPAPSGTLFGSVVERTKAPSAPPIIKVDPIPSPPPVPPALPFQYLGRMSGQNELRVFLSAQGKTFVVKKGDTVLDLYKVEGVSESGVVFTYLPMNERQTLTVSSQQ